MLEKDPKYRIRAEEALKDPYFTDFKMRKRVTTSSSQTDLKAIASDDIRTKVMSNFTKPQKIPYLSKDNDIHNMLLEDPVESFPIKEQPHNQ